MRGHAMDMGSGAKRGRTPGTGDGHDHPQIYGRHRLRLRDRHTHPRAIYSPAYTSIHTILYQPRRGSDDGGDSFIKSPKLSRQIDELARII